MSDYLCISVTFLDSRFHGRADEDDPEWPPSPLRLFQALVAASAGRWNERRRVTIASSALQWLEVQPCPEMTVPSGAASGTKCQLYVPDNTSDLLVPAWKKGNITKQVNRTAKVICPTHIDGDTIHYLYRVSDADSTYIELLSVAARNLTHLGWGIDMVVGNARVLSQKEAAALKGDRWRPTRRGGSPLRVPVAGTLHELTDKHEAFLNRLSDGIFRPVPSLRQFEICKYRRASDPLRRPYRVFELRDTDGSLFRYPHRKLIHISGMVRHLAIEAMKDDPPRGVGEDWVKTYVAGHAMDGAREHRQLSHLPLPSVGHRHTDPGVRRVMIVAPVGDDAWLDHVARRLAGMELKPVRGDEFAGREPPLLVPIPPGPHNKGVVAFYVKPSSVWHSFTPVILPGHDDHKPEKTRRLIEKALAQSGIEQACEFEWSAFSRFPKSFSAHKYDKNKQPQGYSRPGYLNSQTAVHLTLRFHDGSSTKSPMPVQGPIAIGAGRHCGLGLFAAVD